MAIAKTGLKMRSSNQLVISGTDGCIIVDDPWWQTTSFKVCHDDRHRNEKVYTKFFGNGMRYELANFTAAVQNRGASLISPQESMAIIGVMEAFLNLRHNS